MSYNVSTSWATVIAIVAIWDFVWKALGMWRAGRNNQAGWFVVILIINSLGIIPIYYLLTHKEKTSKK
jgi:hypothetical protein